MSHFFRPPSGDRLSQQTVSLNLGGVLNLGLWGPCESAGRYLDIKIDNPSIARFDDILGSARDAVTQQFKLYGQSIGTTRVSAVASSGGVWDWIDVNVQLAPPAPPTPGEQLYKLYQAGRLQFNNPADKANFEAIYAGHRINGRRVQLSDELIEFLNSLLSDGTVNVLSLYRYKQSAHGQEMGSGLVVCRAIDIAAYQGSWINLESGMAPITVIQTIAKIIDNLPATNCQIGFPRPRRTYNTSDPTDFIPELDVFFPVPDQTTAQKCLDGRIAMSRGQLKEPARTHISAALARAEARGAKFAAMYPDGKDHCCIFTLE
jgi:hypothetical protein